MTRKERKFCDIFKISYLDRVGFINKVKEVYIMGHFENHEKMSDKHLDNIINNLVLSKSEIKRTVCGYLRHSKRLHKILHKTYFVISDKRKIISFGGPIFTLYKYIHYSILLSLQIQKGTYNFAFSEVYFAKGVEEAAGCLDTDPNVFANQFMGEYFEGYKPTKNRSAN